MFVQDMEGNDTDTRRRCACDLVKGMAKQFEAETTALCGQHITQLLAAYDANPAAEWQKKDAAVQVGRIHCKVEKRGREG